MVTTKKIQFSELTNFQCVESVPTYQMLRKLESSPTDKESLKAMNFPQFEELFEDQFNSTVYVCSANLASLSVINEMNYRMIVISSEDNPDLMSNVMNTQVAYKEPNFALFKYKQLMSLIFFVVSGINLFLFSLKIVKFQRSETGFLKELIFLTDACLVVYNLFYSFPPKDNWLGRFFDSFVNSSMMGLVLFLNLVFIDSQTNKIQSYVGQLNSVKSFLMPKACICGFIFITLHFFMYSHSIRMHTFVTEMNQMNDSIKTVGLFGSLDLTDCICIAIFSVYGYYCVKSASSAFAIYNEQYHKNRTKQNYNQYNLLFAQDTF